MASFDPQSIPNRFDFAAAQSRIYGEWESRGFFHAEPPTAGHADPSKGPYCIVIPPPNVTGALHHDHALNTQQKHIKIRMHRRKASTTCGTTATAHPEIPTQPVMKNPPRKKKDKTRHDLGREGLVARIWEWKEVYEKRILDQLKQM